MGEAGADVVRGTSRTFIQAIVARGYRPVLEPDAVVRWVTAGAPERELGVEAVLSRMPADSIFALCPTYLGRCDLSEHCAIVERFSRQLGLVVRRRPNLGIVLFVGMQWLESHDSDNEEAALQRLRTLATIAEQHSPSAFVGFALKGPGKNRTINAALGAGEGGRPRGWLWIDDDIQLEDGCLERLIDRFLAEPRRGAVGATIVQRQQRYASSRWLHRVGKLTAPLKAFPTAGCMIVEPRVLRGGIPVRCFADDAFVLFELLDPSRKDPFEALEVVREARAYHPVGGSGRVTYAQWRRRLYTHVIYTAEYPPEVARCYLSSCLFFGLWPISDWDRSLGIGGTMLRWMIKAVHLVLFLGAAANLFVRGVVDRPIDSVSWGSSDEYWRLSPG
jgi:hypothetical protein